MKMSVGLLCKDVGLLIMSLAYSWLVYSKTCESRHSEKRTHSLESTKLQKVLQSKKCERSGWRNRGSCCVRGEGRLLISIYPETIVHWDVLLSLLVALAGFHNVTLLAAIVALRLFETAGVWVVQAFA